MERKKRGEKGEGEGRGRRERGECVYSRLAGLRTFNGSPVSTSHLTAVLRPLMCSMSGFVWALRAQTQVHACAATDISPGSVF